MPAEASRCFAKDWPRCLKLEVDQDLAELAGDRADTFARCACDSVQLASAHTLQRELPGEVSFVCFNARLSKAAKVLGITPMA